MIEKRSTPGVKACGGGLTARAMRHLVDVRGTPYSCLTVHSGLWTTGISSRTPFMWTAERMQWQRQWLDDLRDDGVAVLNETRFSRFEGEGIVTDSGSIRFGHIVGADGAVSRVRRCLGLPPAVGVVALQLREVNAGGVFDVPHVWFSPREFGAGYAWAFPHEGGTRIGLGVPTLTHSSADLKRLFFRFVKRLSISSGNGVLESGSIGCRYCGHRFGRVFLAGDAAGLASPVTGEGIAQALVSGEEVAREIVDSSYRSKIIGALSIAHRRTFDTLANPLSGFIAYEAAALFLKNRWLAEKALSRFSR